MKKPSKKQIKLYYYLTKPGIIYGNLLTTAGGFLLASKGRIDFWLFFAVQLGIALIIASACVFNNYIDRDIDKLMARTKKRALVAGLISARSALTYASILGIIGFLVLILYTNYLTASLGLIAFLTYVILYGISKRHGTYGTIVGSVSGALPPVAGYTSVTGSFDSGALIIFLILVTWQMPHFYAIAMYRLDDYTAAGLPVLPVKRGLKITKLYILSYIVAFIIAVTMLSLFDYTGISYLLVMTTLGLAWLGFGIRSLNKYDDKLWARKMFLFSLLIILSLSVMLSVNVVLP